MRRVPLKIRVFCAVSSSFPHIKFLKNNFRIDLMDIYSKDINSIGINIIYKSICLKIILMIILLVIN
jgi:hypothetical protein